MIQPNELRIGNWVNHAGLKVKLAGHGIALCEEGDLIYDPIPLTPEILEQCGFLPGFIESFLSHFEIMQSGKDEREYFIDVQWIVSFKYLHQLQNLYYALTQQELQVNIGNEQHAVT